MKQLCGICKIEIDCEHDYRIPGAPPDSLMRTNHCMKCRACYPESSCTRCEYCKTLCGESIKIGILRIEVGPKKGEPIATNGTCCEPKPCKLHEKV